MKITKSQLRQIIKEEVSKVLNEAWKNPMEFLEHTIRIVEDYVKKNVLTQSMLNDALELRKKGSSLTMDEVEELSRRLQRNVEQHNQYAHLG